MGISAIPGQVLCSDVVGLHIMTLCFVYVFAFTD